MVRMNSTRKASYASAVALLLAVSPLVLALPAAAGPCKSGRPSSRKDLPRLADAGPTVRFPGAQSDSPGQHSAAVGPRAAPTTVTVAVSKPGPRTGRGSADAGPRPLRQPGSPHPTGHGCCSGPGHGGNVRPSVAGRWPGPGVRNGESFRSGGRQGRSRTGRARQSRRRIPAGAQRSAHRRLRGHWPPPARRAMKRPPNRHSELCGSAAASCTSIYQTFSRDRSRTFSGSSTVNSLLRRGKAQNLNSGASARVSGRSSESFAASFLVSRQESLLYE